MNRMHWTGTAWQDSDEEFHYAYTMMGRLPRAGFALTPQAGQSGYDVYDPDTMAVETTYYRPTGPVLDKMNEWWVFDTVTGTYPAAQRVPIVRTTAVYSDYLGLKTETGFWSNAGGAWSLDRTEYYTYDVDSDYLTGVDYNDGLPNEVTTWSYDAAGNRVSDTSNPGAWIYDGLNRMTASPGTTYSHDIMGNRTLKVGAPYQTYQWDSLSRMTELGTGDDLPYWNYTYRADGMRVSKSDYSGQGALLASSSFYYDGQMGVEDTRIDTNTTVTRYALGKRGIDSIAKSVNGGAESKAYPLYDGHGNMLATLARSGSSYSVANVQSYDAWGIVRAGSSSEHQGYVANLSHRKDGESGLLYMRARYYEPTTGRFVSEDRSWDGLNWYVYANNNPIGMVDADGNSAQSEFYALLADFFKILGAILMGIAVSFVAKKVGSFFKHAKAASWTGKDKRLAARINKFLHALKANSRVRQYVNGTRFKFSVATAVMGYMIIIEGYLLDIIAEQIDPGAGNRGLELRWGW